ncbi:hypothetical protein CCP3SC15_580024 [Gammaproteobacteria bacterium]
MKRIYVLYDGRAWGGDTDEAAVLEAWGPRDGRPSLKHWNGTDGVLYSYRVLADGTTYDERQEEMP